MDIIGDIIENVNNSFQLLNNETPEDLAENAEIGEELDIQDVMNVSLQQWYAPFPQQNDYVNDNSYNVLAYLKKLGYTHAIWELCESHTEYDVCDTLHGRQFTLDELLLNAQHNPPSPIFTLSHPQCYCFLKCFPPAGPEGIPDDAPGLPWQQLTPVRQQKTLKFKKKLYSKMFEVFIDAFTLLPPQDDILKYSYTNIELTSRYAENISSILSYIKPVIINRDITCYMPLHLTRQLEEGSIGCQIKVCNNFSIVYICKLNRLMIIPTPALSSFEFTQGEEVTIDSLKQGDFIALDEDLFGIFQYKDEDGFTTYIPEWNSTYHIGEQATIKLS